MNRLRTAALVFAGIVVIASVVASSFPRFDYARQQREEINAPASSEHWLGTDDLGRDRFARVLCGTRVSMLLAPSAATVSVLLAFVLGAVPGFFGGVSERAAKSTIDLFLAIPWLFLLLMVRAALPLNTSPQVSVCITFLMLGILGWAVPGRIFLARARRLRQSDFILLARAAGVPPFRLLAKHLLPNLRPVVLAQFMISVPVFVLAEANLSILGLGVAEPLPSLGNLLRELETLLSLRADYCRLAALLLLLLLVSSLHLAVTEWEVY
jgi:ABC-type dipeptide/oligopeptide/nickel transport system permease subunit